MEKLKFIFLGPSLSSRELVSLNIKSKFYLLNNVGEFLENTYSNNSIIFLPPISGGDLHAIQNHTNNFCVGIIDGYFENTISVWHKEILHCLSCGNQVYGAASMGALRASELDVFGMNGIGKIYEDFKNGILEDDDEVAISHGPKEIHYHSLSDAMVNIRYSFNESFLQNVISSSVQQILLKIAKSLFYKDRNYEFIIETYKNYYGSTDDIIKLITWIKLNAVDQKKNDAIELIRKLDSYDIGKMPVSFKFEDSSIWRHFIGA